MVSKNRITSLLVNPNRIIVGIFNRLSPFIHDDETAVRIAYLLSMHKRLHLNHPQTFNEKLQWLKLHDKHPEYTQMVDKIEAKKIAARIIGDEHIIPTLGVWDKFEDIDFEKLPNQFVLKCNHDSGGIVICKDKSKMDITEARKKINRCLRRNPFWATREYPYKDVKPRILAEKYMVDPNSTTDGLTDYKFFCFNGVPKFMFVATNRPTDTRFDFFDISFHHLPFKQGHPLSSKPIRKPERYAEMVEIAKKLSKGYRHVRIDLYNMSGKIYFGEYTFFHYSGMVPFKPYVWDEKLGGYLNTPPRKKVNRLLCNSLQGFCIRLPDKSFHNLYKSA